MSTLLSTATTLRPLPLAESAVPCQLDGHLVPACDFPHCFACKRVQKLTHVCDGTRPLSEVAEVLRLDERRVQQYAQQAVQEGWVEVVPAAASDYASTLGPTLSDQLQALLLGLEQKLGPQRAAALWSRAERMVRAGGDVNDWLIALQLCGDDLEARVVERLLGTAEA